MDLDSAADELYGLPPDEFAQCRTRLAAQAKAAGDRALAASIGKLRKPVLAATLVNVLVRGEPPELRELTELGEQLRSAHRQLRGAELRALSEQRQHLLHRLTERVRDRAGGKVTESVLAQVRSTFEAAIADEGAEAAVLSGRLTTVLSYSGFGEVDVTDAVALPVRRRHLRSVPTQVADVSPAKPAPDEQSPASRASQAAEQARQRRLQRRQNELRRAITEHTKAIKALEQAVQDADTAERQHADASARVERLRAELSQAQELASQAGRTSRSAERARDSAQDEADRTAAAMQAARDRLDAPGARTD